MGGVRHACRVTAEDLGPFLLGQLPPAQAEQARSAVAECPLCSLEVARLRPVVAALGRVRPGADVPAAPAPALERVLAEVHGDVASRRRRAVLAAAGGLVLAVTVAAGVLAARPDDSAPRDVVLVGRPGAAGTVSVDARGWGTELVLDVRGLTPGRTYGAWLADRTGQRVSAGTFRPAEHGAVRVDLAAALPLADTGSVGVTEIGGVDVLRGQVG